MSTASAAWNPDPRPATYLEDRSARTTTRRITARKLALLTTIGFAPASIDMLDYIDGL